MRLSLEGCFPSQKHGEQLLTEAVWILDNLQKSENPNEILKWTQKWRNWSKAHPNEAEQIKKQIADNLYNKLRVREQS